jgi:hypothetical protein
MARKVLVPVALMEYCLQALTWVRGQVGSENDRRAAQIERILKRDAKAAVARHTSTRAP